VKTLDLDQKLDVKYAIPLWLRDEQIKLALEKVKGRIQPVHEPRTEPIAIAGFGPSLKYTWEKIRDCKFIMSCSGSHRFLIDRGLVPNWHVEVDPREHKIKLLGEPHPSVEYLIASTCHPKYFDHLDGFNVKLWHVFDPSEDGLRMLPPGEWAVTGGCDVGLRCLTLAGFLGFRDLQIFGLDGCAEAADGIRHAAEHPHGQINYSVCKYEGKDYFTTAGMLAAARSIFHELDQMPKVSATFHGNGLIQDMAKKYVPNHKANQKPLSNIVGFAKPELISSEYRNLNTRLHRDNLAYGVGGSRHAPTVLKLAQSISSQSILDYGCGKGLLAKALPFPIWEYDPAIPGKDLSPRAADLVVCTDVLEHIEPDKLVFVLNDIKRCARKIAYFVIHTGPSTKQLADGRNSHLIQQPAKWWKKTLRKFFEIPLNAIIEQAPLVHIVAGPRKDK